MVVLSNLSKEISSLVIFKIVMQITFTFQLQTQLLETTSGKWFKWLLGTRMFMHTCSLSFLEIFCRRFKLHISDGSLSLLQGIEMLSLGSFKIGAILLVCTMSILSLLLSVAESMKQFWTSSIFWLRCALLANVVILFYYQVVHCHSKWMKWID